MNITTLDEVILNGLSHYVRGRAEEIVARHIEQAKKEIEDAVREEVSKTVLSVGKIVNFKTLGSELIITIHDQRGSTPTEIKP